MGIDERAIEAHHEAGHAVACYIFGVPIIEAWISPDGTGGVRHQLASVRKGTARWRVHCRRRAMISLAGPAAQELFTYDGRPADRRWWSDHENAKKWMDEIDETSDWRSVAPALIEETFLMLMERPTWRAIGEVADLLVNRGRLPGAFVEQLCRRFKVEQK